MPDNVIKAVNDMDKQEGMPNRIQFRNIHHESTLADLFTENDLQDDNSCASDADWDLNKKPEEDLKKITFDNHFDDDEVKDSTLTTKTYFTSTMVAILDATLEFNKVVQ